MKVRIQVHIIAVTLLPSANTTSNIVLQDALPVYTCMYIIAEGAGTYV